MDVSAVCVCGHTSCDAGRYARNVTPWVPASSCVGEHSICPLSAEETNGILSDYGPGLQLRYSRVFTSEGQLTKRWCSGCRRQHTSGGQLMKLWSSGCHRQRTSKGQLMKLWTSGCHRQRTPEGQLMKLWTSGCHRQRTPEGQLMKLWRSECHRQRTPEGQLMKLWRSECHRQRTSEGQLMKLWSSGPGCTTTSQADLLPRWQKVRQSQAKQTPAQMHRRSRLGDNVCLCNPPFWIVTALIFKCHGRQLAPNWCTLGGGRVGM